MDDVSEGVFFSTVASLHGIDLKPLQTLFLYSWLVLAEFVFAVNSQLLLSSNIIGRNEYEAEESETPRSPRFEL